MPAALPAAASALPRPGRGFTLLEIMISICLLVLLLSVAVPSLSGQLSRQRLKGAFDRFEALAADAQKHSVAEGRPYILVWERDGAVRLYPADLSTAERKKATPSAALVPNASHGGERYVLKRPSALTAAPGPFWTFWPSGNCEPVVVAYEGPAGDWEATYDPLSGQGTLNTFHAR